MIHWRVGFCDAEDVSPWQRLLKPGYRHCWGARELDEGCWMWVEWTPERVIYGIALPGLIDRCTAAAHEVLLWVDRVEDDPYPRRPLLALHHCASILSHTMGVRPRPLATPWWLRCALLKRGAQVLMPAKEPA